MQKRIALITIVAIAILIPILLLLPTGYKITVYSSVYYGKCTDNYIKGESQCKTINPPVVIEKQEPYLSAWWNKTQIERQFAIKDVTTEWTGNGVSGFGLQATSVLAVLIIVLELLLIIGIIYLFIATLIRAFKLKGSERVAWICLIVFVFPLGSIIYALSKPETK